MFESTLQAQGLDEGERRLGSLSAAALAHLGIGLAILTVTAIIVPPVKIPEPHGMVVTIVQGVRLDVSPHPALPAPIKGTEMPKPSHAIAPRPLAPETPPSATPPMLPSPAPESAPPGPEGRSDGPLGDRNGSLLGVPGGPGSGAAGPGVDRDAGPVYLTGDMVKPVLLVKVEPSYPEVARRAGLGGRVTVRAVIGLDGGIESAEVFASTNPLFDQAALDAVRRWRYRPALMNGGAVRVYFTVVVDFLVR